MKGAAVAAAGLTLLAGCLSVPGNLPPYEFFVLNDLATADTSSRMISVTRVLLVSPTATSPFYDTQSLVFSRAPGQRAYYQFAGWTERPGRRFAELLLRRLEARGAFKAVASTTAGVTGDLVLSTRLEEFYQDVSSTPGSVRVELSAELVGHAERSLIARRRFLQVAPTDGSTAGGAVTASNRAVTALLEELSAWVESAAVRPVSR